MHLIIDALAAYRIARLIVDDSIFDDARDTAVGWMAQPSSGKTANRLAEPIADGCYWCVGVWTAAGVVAARRFAPRAWAPIARVLATSTIVGVVAQHADD